MENTKRPFHANTRRSFLAKSALIASSALIATDAAIAEAPMSKLTEDDPIAVALGYAADATTVDVAKYPKRAGEAGAKQLCSSCALYKPTGTAGHGTCAAIPGKLVASAGWCNVWAPAG